MDNKYDFSEIKCIHLYPHTSGWEIDIILQNGYEIKKSGAIAPDQLKENLHKYLLNILEDPEEHNDPRIPSYVHEMKRMFDRSYNTHISLDSLENKLDISKYRLCHEFKQYIGESPKQYLIRRRLNAARILLANTDMKVYEVALNVGYDNINHFINLFKKQFGITPSDYRKEQL